MELFKRDIRFTGKHAEIMQRLCKDKGSDQDVPFKVKDIEGKEQDICIFDTRITCFLVAAMLGIINNKNAPVDRTNPAQSHIFADMFDKYRHEIERIYQHMILSDVNLTDPDTKIKKAFTVDSDYDSSEVEEQMLGYVRGGLEILDDYFNSNKCLTYEDVCSSIIDLVNTVDVSYAE